MYEITKKEFKSDDNVVYTSYGIISKSDNIIIDDICCDYNRFVKWVNNLNKLNLSTIHIFDAVNDFLAQ